MPTCPFPPHTILLGWGPWAPAPKTSNEMVAACTKHLCSQALRWGWSGGRRRRQVRGLGIVGAAALLRGSENTS